MYSATDLIQTRNTVATCMYVDSAYSDSSELCQNA